MPETLHSRALKRAAELLGGTEELRVYLKVSTWHLRSWMQGKSRPPDAVFLRVVDVLAREDPQPIAAREPAR